VALVALSSETDVMGAPEDMDERALEFRRRTRRFDAADYRLSPRAPVGGKVPA
jgi:hypothetical protein